MEQIRQTIEIEMKHLTILIIALFLGGTSFSASLKTAGAGLTKISKGKTVKSGIQFFEGSWKQALAKAKKEKKLIFLDAYASWCGPCKWMEKNAFVDDKVGAYFNEHFINFKMDMEKNPEGSRLSKKYKLMAYPSLYFVDKNEEIVHSKVGALKAEELLSLGKTVGNKQI